MGNSFKKRTETDLVKACLLYLKSKGIMAWRVNSGAWKVGNRFIKFGEKGSSDIHGIYKSRCGHGHFLAVECKSGKNRLTDHQAEWLRRVENQGGLALVVWSVAELEAFLKSMAL